MRNTDIEYRMQQLSDEIAIKEAELAHRANRNKEIAAWPTQNKSAQRQFLARLKTEIMQMTEELNAKKTELWGLQEMEISNTSSVW